MDFFEHVFFDCTVARTLWSHVENKLVTIVSRCFKLALSDVLFGFKDKKLNARERNRVNLIILLGKMSISIVKKTKSTSPMHLVFEQNVRLRMA